MVIPFLRLNIHFAFSIKKGRLDEAEQSLIRVFGSDYDAKQDVINISENLQHLRNVTHFKLDYSLLNCCIVHVGKSTICCEISSFQLRQVHLNERQRKSALYILSQAKQGAQE